MTDKKRECKDCTDCCTAIAVEALNKPCSQRCEHQVVNAHLSGCSLPIVEKPDECKSFNCLWLEGKAGDIYDRPNRMGFFLTLVTSQHFGLALTVHETVNNSVEYAKPYLLKIAEQHKATHIQIISPGRRRIIFLSDSEEVLIKHKRLAKFLDSRYPLTIKQFLDIEKW